MPRYTQSIGYGLLSERIAFVNEPIDFEFYALDTRLYYLKLTIGDSWSVGTPNSHFDPTGVQGNLVLSGDKKTIQFVSGPVDKGTISVNDFFNNIKLEKNTDGKTLDFIKDGLTLASIDLESFALSHKEDAFTKLTAFNRNFGTNVNDVPNASTTLVFKGTITSKGILDFTGFGLYFTAVPIVIDNINYENGYLVKKNAIQTFFPFNNPKKIFNRYNGGSWTEWESVGGPLRGEVMPANTLGGIGDVYIDTKTSKAYLKTSATLWKELAQSKSTIDSVLSEISENPLQNKVIKAEFDKYVFGIKDGNIPDAKNTLVIKGHLATETELDERTTGIYSNGVNITENGNTYTNGVVIKMAKYQVFFPFNSQRILRRSHVTSWGAWWDVGSPLKGAAEPLNTTGIKGDFYLRDTGELYFKSSNTVWKELGTTTASFKIDTALNDKSENAVSNKVLKKEFNKYIFGIKDGNIPDAKDTLINKGTATNIDNLDWGIYQASIILNSKNYSAVIQKMNTFQIAIFNDILTMSKNRIAVRNYKSPKWGDWQEIGQAQHGTGLPNVANGLKGDLYVRDDNHTAYIKTNEWKELMYESNEDLVQFYNNI